MHGARVLAYVLVSWYQHARSCGENWEAGVESSTGLFIISCTKLAHGHPHCPFKVQARLSVYLDLAEDYRMAPERLVYEVPLLRLRLVLSYPARRGETIDETPYGLLQLCDPHDHCETLIDVMGGGGVTLADDATLTFSPDREYLIVLQMVAVDPEAREYRSHYYEHYSLRDPGPAVFRTPDGREATTDNILHWSPDEPHALVIATGFQRTALAYPVSGGGS